MLVRETDNDHPSVIEAINGYGLKDIAVPMNQSACSCANVYTSSG